MRILAGPAKLNTLKWYPAAELERLDIYWDYKVCDQGFSMVTRGQIAALQLNSFKCTDWRQLMTTLKEYYDIFSSSYLEQIIV